MYKCESCQSLHTTGNHLCHCGSFLWRIPEVGDTSGVIWSDSLNDPKITKFIDESIVAFVKPLQNSWVTGK